MNISHELVNLFTRTPTTWESSWATSGRRPDSRDKFWKFRLPSMDWKKDQFGAFHYTQQSVALLDSPLTDDEMVALYCDLGERRRTGGADRDMFDAEMIMLSMDLMDVVADRVKRREYSSIASQNLFSDHNLLIEGLKVGDRYREATLMYPSSDWPRSTYVKGRTLVPSLGQEVDMWMGPYKTRWKDVDTSNNRSGVLVDFAEGPVYHWFFDAFADAVNKEASRIGFRTSMQITEAQELRIRYTT